MPSSPISASRRSAIVLLLAWLVTLAPARVLAQDSGELTVVAAGLIGPRGFIVGDDAALFVALAGIGGDQPGTAAPISDSPISGGPSASVVRVEEGCSTVLADRLPSAVGATGRTVGASDVSVLDGQLYVLVAGGGAAHGQSDAPNGIYVVTPEGDTELVADLSAWFRRNPVARPTPLDADPEGLPFSMAPIDGELWVVDAAAEQILRVTTDGTIARLVDFSAAPIGPMAIVPAPDGGAYVAAMGTAPYGPRTGKIVIVTPTGTVTDVWTGLTAPVGVAVDDAGTLYALETSTSNSPVSPFLAPRAGRLIRQAGLDGRDVLARRLNLPTALAAGPDGTFYVAVSADDETGAILRIAPGVGEELVAPSGELVGPRCEDSGESGLRNVRRVLSLGEAS